jgi:hypothetical protein
MADTMGKYFFSAGDYPAYKNAKDEEEKRAAMVAIEKARGIYKEIDDAAKAQAEADKEAGKAKLAALGLTDAEIEALVK